jgi:hypothetical protein
MNKKTYYLIADIIQRYRTWIIVKDTEQLVEMRILHDGVLKPLFYKGLSLQSYRDHYSFKKKRTWALRIRRRSVRIDMRTRVSEAGSLFLEADL